MAKSRFVNQFDHHLQVSRDLVPRDLERRRLGGRRMCACAACGVFAALRGSPVHVGCGGTFVPVEAGRDS